MLSRNSMTAFLMATFTALTIVSNTAVAEAECTPVNGHIDSQQLLPPPFGTCASAVGLCTSGTLIGGIQGQFNFTGTSITPSPLLDPTTLSPFVALFTGQTVIQTKDGNSLFATNAGALDTDPFGDGHFADLITFTGGTENLAEASGHIVAFGDFSFTTGVGASDYRGEVCTP